MLVITLILPVHNVSASTSTSAEDLVDYALEFKGTPYKFGGTTPKTGFDCSGFLLYVFNNFEVELPRTSVDQFKIGEKVEKKDLIKGDLVFFKNTYKKGISHSGIYVGDNKFISAKSSGVKVESLNHSYWGPKYAGARRIIEEPEEVEEVLEELALGRYYDVPESHWGYEAVYEMSHKGIVNGFEQSHFKPNELLTRAQLAVMLNRELKLTAKNPATFSDVSKTASSYQAIAALQEAGIITGFSNGTFQPNEPVTRAQMAIILQRAYKLAEAEVKTAKQTFSDVPADHPAYEAIQLMRDNGITTGYPDGTYQPDEYTSRIEFTVFLYRVIK